MKKLLLIISLGMAIVGCQREEITIGTHASDVFYLLNKGSAMPVRVHGNTASKTFMLMIHGGPGGDAIIYRSPYVVENLEEEIAMVYWDQRNGGATQGGANGANDEVDIFIEDLEKMVALLKHRYGDDISLFVNGHSWGGFLTPAFLQKDQNQYLVKGWIQSAGAHNIPLLNGYARQMLLDKAAIEIAAGNNTAKWTEIQDFCNSITLPLNAEKGLKLNGYCFEGQTLTPELPGIEYNGTAVYLQNDFPLLQLTTGRNSVPISLTNWLFTDQQLSDNMSVITIPTLLLFGKYDYVCPPLLADDIESRIQSAYKRKVVFEKSGHGVMFGADEQAYWTEVIAFIRTFK